MAPLGSASATLAAPLVPAPRDRATAGLSPDDVPASLGEMNASVAVPAGGHWLRRFLAFLGPGYMVSVGYMDPGNWATDIAGGSQFGYLQIGRAHV